ncbi:uncharacterized protein LOC117114302 [Anneissia japonica]|uniref:uncharacterized protein LOC117114302 n=1 Tax=Anneissia japonica TaxID=1529436 RepID=UPI0014255B92|nr:uncharacterized protein LOC117114302 [Anneissia japonica]
MGGQASKETDQEQMAESVTTARLQPFLQKLKDKCQNGPVTEAHFKNLFPCEGHPLVCRIYRILCSEHGDFFDNVSTLFSNILLMESAVDKVGYYLSLYVSQDGTHHEEDVEEFVGTAFTLFLTNLKISHNASEAEKNTMMSVRTGLTTSVAEAKNYILTNCPGLVPEVHCWLTTQITRPGMSEGVDYSDGPCKTVDQLLNMASWWLFSCSLPSLYTNFQSASNHEAEKQYFMPLYNSSEHGQSMNRFQHHVLAYRGPTVTLVAFQDHVIAVALDSEWRDGTGSIGGVNCACVMLTSKYEIIEEGEGMAMFNMRSRNIAKGISIGRNRKNPVLVIESGMEEVTYKMETYNLKRIEVWGCGGDAAKTEQLKQKQREVKDAEKNLKVKRPGRWDDNPDRYLLELGGVKVNHAES